MTDRWTTYALPGDMTSRSFLDVGCWEGDFCIEALRRGARTSTGVDACSSPTLEDNLRVYGFAFWQTDVTSETFLSVPPADIVWCGGVLYHVPNPMSLLIRLRRVTTERLWIETEHAGDVPAEPPLLRFWPGDTLDGNPSNWWTPNETCLHEMLLAAGFTNPRTTSSNERRICVRADAGSAADPFKALPRRPDWMNRDRENGAER